MEKKLVSKVDNFNAIMSRSDRVSRLSYAIDASGKFATLYLCNEPQMNYGTYQCELYRGDIEHAIEAVRMLLMTLNFELNLGY